MRGHIKMLNLEKGYGFILGEDKVERFFHRSVLRDANFNLVQQGQPVLFDHVENERGARALNVTIPE